MSGRAEAAAAAGRILSRARAQGFRGPDPYDALSTGWPAPLVGGRRRRQAVIQAHARSPVDIRRLYRRRHPRIVKALALFGDAARKLGDDEYARTAFEAILEQGDGAAGWGYPFDVQTRWSFYPADTPNIIVTSFAGLALARAEHLDERFGEAARRAAGWVREALLTEDGFFAYHPGSTALIHNANILGAQLVHTVLGSGDATRRALALTLEAQQADGAFPYGEGAGLGFVDSFHTGFVLAGLVGLDEGSAAVQDALERGAAFYAARFFGPAGEPRLWPAKPFPEDAHSAGTGLSTLSALEARGIVPAALTDRVAARVLSHVVRGDTTVFRRYRWGRTTVSYLRWCDAHVAQGLADYATGAPRAAVSRARAAADS